MSLTVGELQVLLTGDTRPLDRSLDKIDDRADKSEKHIETAFDRAGASAGKSLDKGIEKGLDNAQVRVEHVGKLINAEAIDLGLNVGKAIDSGLTEGAAQAGANSAEEFSRTAEPAFEKASRKVGENSGGVLAQGINTGLIRNSPLIAAAIAGGLIAGAPLAIAGATALFGGIAAVAASQNAEVRKAWTGLGSQIRDEAVADAGVLTSTFVGTAGRIGAAFERLRPQLRDAFAASGPGIDAVTDGVVDLANNAMPALVTAVEKSGPVMDGLQSLLGSVGAGLGGFFDEISDHSGAAGTALAAIGDIVANLLPTLGTLMGSGAELASVVLPPLADALGVVADVAGALGPLLPALVLGFTGMKVAQAAAGYVQTFALQAQFATTALTGNATAGTKAGTALGSLGKALPVIGIVFAAATASIEANRQKVDQWSEAILQGGDAAEKAAAQAKKASGGWLNAITDFGQFGGHEGPDSVFEQMFGGDDDELWQAAVKNAKDLTAAMSPLQLAQQNVTTTSDALDEAVGRYGESSPQAAAASRDYAAAQSALETQQRAVDAATRTATSAIVDQSLQMLAAGNADLQYRQARLGVVEAQQRLNEMQASGTATATELRGAQLQVEQSMYQAAAAADAKARADNAGKSEAELNRVGAMAQLATLQDLAAQMGTATPAAIQQQIAALQASAGQGGITAAAMQDLDLSVRSIPDSKDIRVNAPTADQKQRLQDLGYTVTNIPGSKDVRITANTSEAQAAISALVNRNYTINVRATMPDLNGAESGSGRMGTYGAIGGIVHAYASGGFERLTPMQGGIAQMVKPNTFRVIGDRVRDDEAYIPINGDARSLSILSETARRMGGQFVPNGAGLSGATGGSTGTGSGTVIAKHYNISTVVREVLTEDQIMRAVRQSEAIYG